MWVGSLFPAMLLSESVLRIHDARGIRLNPFIVVRPRRVVMAWLPDWHADDLKKLLARSSDHK